MGWVGGMGYLVCLGCIHVYIKMKLGRLILGVCAPPEDFVSNSPWATRHHAYAIGSIASLRDCLISPLLED